MFKAILYIIFVLLVSVSYSQRNEIDSLKMVLEMAPADSNKVNTLITLSSYFYRTSPSEAIRYGIIAQEIAEQINYAKGAGYAFKSIGMGHYFQGNYSDALLSWQEALITFQSIDFKDGESNMLNNLGAVYFNQGQDTKAIDYYLQSLKLAEEIGDRLRIATALVNIGGVYFNKSSTFDLAQSYYLQSLPISEELDDHEAIGTVTVNLGEIYLERGNRDSKNIDTALYYFDRALVAYQQSKGGNIPYALNSLGKAWAIKGDYKNAENYQKQAIELAKSNNARLEIAISLIGLGNTYKQFRKFNLAIEAYKEALDNAENINATYQIKESYEGLANCYAKLGIFNEAYKYQNLLTNIKDTLYNADLEKNMETATLNFEIERKQGQIVLLTKDKELQELDIRQQKTIRNAAAIVGILMLILAAGLFHRYRFTHKTNKIIAAEKERSDNLLLNILPEETAEELKQNGKATPKHYETVSVLFTDFKGFTKIAEKLTPQELVAELNHCFLEFDFIIDEFNLEKIKTIGDAYMCAGGIPIKNTTNPVDIVHAGLKIKEYMEHLKKVREEKGEDYWELRIGIHTGPVIAGVVGKNKFAYDIWGDAVNTASRMESSGVPGKVNISGTTYELVKDHFECTYRGKIQAKNKGEIDMYIVEGVKKEIHHLEAIEA